MKVVYLAHPISGDVKSNLAKIIDEVRYINLTFKDVVPFVPYYTDCIALNDSKLEERQRGIKNNQVFFKRKIIDELWVLSYILSTGVAAEIQLANSLKIPVFHFVNRKLQPYDLLRR